MSPGKRSRLTAERDESVCRRGAPATVGRGFAPTGAALFVLLPALLGVAPAAAQSVAGSGFPGDTFTIRNESTGILTGSGLSVVPNVGTVTTTADGWSWLTPTWAEPGEYQLTLSVTGPLGTDSLTRSIWLCNEAASLGVAPDLPGFLVGETATLSTGASQGHPSSFDFVLPAGVTPSGSASGVAPPGTLGITFAACGNLTLRAVARYAHAGPDGGCGAWYTDSRPTLYDACAELPPRLVAPARSSFLVKQNGAITAQPLVSVETVLEFTGKVAPGYSPTFAWSYPGAGGCVYTNAAGGYTGSTCRIPAGTLTAGQPVALTLGVHLSPTPPAGCAASVNSVATTITPRAATAGFQMSATTVVVGQNLSLVLENLSGTFSTLRYDLGGGQSCSGQTSVTIPSIFGGYNNGDTVVLQLATTGIRTVTLYGTPAGGTELLLDSHEVTVALPGAPALSAPGGAGSGATYEVSWTATSPGNGYELQEATEASFAFPEIFTVAGTSRPFAHAPVATTTYSTRVRALAACGAVNYPSAWSNTGATTVEGSTIEVQEQTVSTTVTIEATDQVLAGPGLVVTAPGQLFLRAGTRVVLRNGVAVGPGARLTVALGPG